MTRLIDDLLSLSRIELRAHVQPQTPVDVVPIVRAMIDTLGPLARERGVEIALSGGAEPLMVFGDRDELSRLAENLIENAVKYGGGASRSRSGARRRSRAGHRRSSFRCATTDRASRPSICRG
jgi:two-component system phosphate regulon sensor histidine kinase PhoR